MPDAAKQNQAPVPWAKVQPRVAESFLVASRAAGLCTDPLNLPATALVQSGLPFCELAENKHFFHIKKLQNTLTASCQTGTVRL